MKKITCSGLNDIRVSNIKIRNSKNVFHTRFPASPDLHSPSNPTHPIDLFYDSSSGYLIIRLLVHRNALFKRIRSINASINTSSRREEVKGLPETAKQPYSSRRRFISSPLPSWLKLARRQEREHHRIPRFSRRVDSRVIARLVTRTRGPDNALTRGGEGKGKGRQTGNKCDECRLDWRLETRGARRYVETRVPRAIQLPSLSDPPLSLPSSSPPFDLSRPLCRLLVASSLSTVVRFHSREGISGVFGSRRDQIMGLDEELLGEDWEKTRVWSGSLRWSRIFQLPWN